jgi:hypothetical protein
LKAALCRFRFAFISLSFLIYSKPAKIEINPWSNFRGPPQTEETEGEKSCQKCAAFRCGTGTRVAATNEGFATKDRNAASRNQKMTTDFTDFTDGKEEQEIWKAEGRNF